MFNFDHIPTRFNLVSNNLIIKMIALDTYIQMCRKGTISDNNYYILYTPMNWGFWDGRSTKKTWIWNIETLSNEIVKNRDVYHLQTLVYPFKMISSLYRMLSHVTQSKSQVIYKFQIQSKPAGICLLRSWVHSSGLVLWGFYCCEF